jgi:hypothetical protein
MTMDFPRPMSFANREALLADEIPGDRVEVPDTYEVGTIEQTITDFEAAARHEIHTNVAGPYVCAKNLALWIKRLRQAAKRS